MNVCFVRERCSSIGFLSSSWREMKEDERSASADNEDLGLPIPVCGARKAILERMACEVSAAQHKSGSHLSPQRRFPLRFCRAGTFFCRTGHGVLETSCDHCSKISARHPESVDPRGCLPRPHCAPAVPTACKPPAAIPIPPARRRGPAREKDTARWLKMVDESRTHGESVLECFSAVLDGLKLSALCGLWSVALCSSG